MVCGVLVLTVQFVHYFLSSLIGGLTGWLSIFQFDFFRFVTSNPGVCIAPFSPLTKLSAGLFSPLIGYALLCLNFGLEIMKSRIAVYLRSTQSGQQSTQIATSPSMRSLPNGSQSAQLWLDPSMVVRYRRTTIAYLFSSYPALIQSVFSYFSCQSVGGSVSVLASYPSIRCDSVANDGDREYHSLKALFIVLLILLVTLPLILFTRMYVLHRSGLLFGSTDIKSVYAVVIGQYKPAYYYFECFVLLRRLIIAAASFEQNTRQRFAFFVSLRRALFAGEIAADLFRLLRSVFM